VWCFYFWQYLLVVVVLLLVVAAMLLAVLVDYDASVIVIYNKIHQQKKI